MLPARDVPEDVHADLRRRAAAAGGSLSDFARQELSLVARRPSVAELLGRTAAQAADPMTFLEARQAVVADRRVG